MAIIVAEFGVPDPESDGSFPEAFFGGKMGLACVG
jgi:hypothetical protein